ncbi:hypothetical protein BDW02DRAFT_500730 [Decorospora gaudefroyi]|uniref:Uncharacterized protein n=1 Tax=Decorospora gaudefroyi TaxID=184978 RepID=A0A6A5KE65_9PLEO|nr:hypothetical protein BDW02DRAFT_500730 [Decorospora gaudefroyi]
MPLSISYLEAVLTTAEVNALSDPTKSYRDAFNDLICITDSLANDFGETMRIKNTLDAYEEKARAEPSWPVLAVLLNCEYALWRINEAIRIEFNPFLSHWIEALLRLEKELTEATTIKAARGIFSDHNATDAITTEEIGRTRAVWIKWVVGGRPSRPSHLSPLIIYRAVCTEDFSLPDFDTHYYIQVLVDTEVWDKPRELQVPGVPTQKQNTISKAKRESDESTAQQAKSSEQWQDVLLRKIKEDRFTAVRELRCLPLTISSLDFLTTLVTDGTLEKYEIESAFTIMHYVQHALRLVERMEAPPPTSEQDMSTNGTVDGGDNMSPVMEYGKEAQSRAVKLLLLFIKNLIRKDLLEPICLAWEINEICVRYIWVKEVRDFKRWVEEGEESEDGESVG